MAQHSLGRILIVDDEKELLDVLCDFLSLAGYEAVGFTLPSQVLEIVKEQEFDILITDLVMPGMSGIELLGACKQIDPDLVGIIMTGWGTIQSTVDAMKVGAFDYLLKPFKMDLLLPIVDRAMNMRQLRQENIELRGAVAIYELTHAINVTMDADVIADKVAAAVVEQCGADEASIMLPAEEDDELYVAAVRGIGREALLGKRVRISEGVAGWVARNQETLTLKGKIEDPRFNPVAPRPEIKAAVSLPLVAGGNFVGILNINSIRRKSFTPGQIKALDIIVGMAAPSIESSALFARVQAIEEKYRDIVENSVEGIFQISRDGKILMANPSLVRILGYESPQELLAASQDIVRRIFADDELNRKWMQEMERRGEVRNIEAQILGKDQSKVWALINARVVRNRNGQDLYYEGAVVDIGQQKRLEAILIKTARQWETTFDSIRDIVWLTDMDGKIQRCNKAAQQYFKKSFSEIIGRFCFEVMHDGQAPMEDCPLAKMKKTKKRESKNLLIDGRWYNITVDPIRDEIGDLKGAVHVVSDVTVQKCAEEELRVMSLRDELTGLLNRRGFMNLAEQQLRLAQRMKKMLILFFIDLDRMKWINDTLGHPEGDRALKNAGNILKKTFRESDLIARVGGDEFVVVTLNAFDESTETILARLERNLSTFNEENQAPYPLSLSIGAVTSEEEELDSIELLLTRADLRMYENKKAKILNKL